VIKQTCEETKKEKKQVNKVGKTETKKQVKKIFLVLSANASMLMTELFSSCIVLK